MDTIGPGQKILHAALFAIMIGLQIFTNALEKGDMGQMGNIASSIPR